MPLRINPPSSSTDRYRGKKSYKRGLSWPPSSPLTPGEALEASRVDARRELRSPRLAASHHHGVLTPPRVVTTAARDTAAPLLRSTRDRSIRPPWRVSAAASVWRCRASLRGGVTAGVRRYAVSRSYSRYGR